MTTDQLIEALVGDLQATERARKSRALIWAMAVGAAATVGGFLVFLCLRAHEEEITDLGSFLARLVLTLGVVATVTALTVKLIRPGREPEGSVARAVLPLASIVAFTAGTLVLTYGSTWGGMIVGMEWLIHLLSVPIFAVVSFAALIWARHEATATDPMRDGAVVGFVAGGLSAGAYAFQCPDDSLPFIAVWCGGTIALCTFVGAKLGPRLLRW